VVTLHGATAMIQHTAEMDQCSRPIIMADTHCLDHNYSELQYFHFRACLLRKM